LGHRLGREEESGIGDDADASGLYPRLGQVTLAFVVAHRDDAGPAGGATRKAFAKSAPERTHADRIKGGRQVEPAREPKFVHHAEEILPARVVAQQAAAAEDKKIGAPHDLKQPAMPPAHQLLHALDPQKREMMHRLEAEIGVGRKDALGVFAQYRDAYGQALAQFAAKDAQQGLVAHIAMAIPAGNHHMSL